MRKMICLLAAVALALPVGAQDKQHGRGPALKEKAEVRQESRETIRHTDREVPRERAEVRERAVVRERESPRKEAREEHREREHTRANVRVDVFRGTRVFEGNRVFIRSQWCPVRTHVLLGGIWFDYVILMGGCDYYLGVDGCWYPVFEDCGVIVCN